jgi:hypothetical protein
MSANNELPTGASEHGVDFDVALVKRLLDRLETFARQIAG